MTNKEIVQSDLESIYIGNIYTVEADLNLPSQGRLGSALTWDSSFTHIINSDGKVTRPRTGSGNRPVNLTATAVMGSESGRRVFEVTVLETPSRIKITGVLPVEVTIGMGMDYNLPGFVIITKEGNIFGASPVKWVNAPVFSGLKPGIYEISGEPLDVAPKFTPSARITVAKNYADGEQNKYVAGGTPALPKRPELASPFELDAVKLLPGAFDDNRRRFEECLLACDDDQMLYNFRAASGLDTKGAEPMSGWDSPECLLRGHTTGHYLSGIALASRGCPDNSENFKKKIEYMVDSLEECQNAFAASGGYAGGFLSGYSEEQFDLLEEYVVYPKIWAPYYTLHKILAGLLDCHEFGGSAKALTVAEKVGMWTYNRLAKLSAEQLAKMWAMYIAGEFGGMNETMARLYKLSPKPEFIKAAKFFDNEKLFLPMAANIDTLCDMHGNQHVPQIIGALEIYERTHEDYYYNIARNFWRFVTDAHCYNIGGSGEGEMFKEPGYIAAYLTDKTAESCVSYNMMKLSRMLFRYEPVSGYMDYYERALYNHIAPSGDPNGPSGGSAYFTPLRPGGQKSYDEKSNSCCHGTGLENHVKYQDSIYYTNGDTLYVNLYIASELSWREKGVVITQSGDFLKDQRVIFDIGQSARIDLRLRMPAWLEEKAEIKHSGVMLDFEVKDGYAVINRDFAPGDKLEISLPFTLRLEKAADDPAVACLYYGPLVMVIDNDSQRFIELCINDTNLLNKTGDLEFTFEGFKFIPIMLAHNAPYHAYFNLK
ncbi:MAG: glycoside hydrolase family 127 protein [Defluviitaleaceae bacterium]|nr:glycoside hydrolase family 127 protein [Defluviitaleaceae bacterium]